MRFSGALIAAMAIEEVGTQKKMGKLRGSIWRVIRKIYTFMPRDKESLCHQINKKLRKAFFPLGFGDGARRFLAIDQERKVPKPLNLEATSQGDAQQVSLFSATLAPRVL